MKIFWCRKVYARNKLGRNENSLIYKLSIETFCFLVNFDKIVFISSISSKVDTYEIERDTDDDPLFLKLILCSSKNLIKASASQFNTVKVSKKLN